MAVKNPAKVPKKEITSIDVTNFSGGWNLLGEQNADINQIVEAIDIERSTDGYIRPRRSLQPWLPNTIDTVYQVYPALVDNDVVNFVADNGKVRYCMEGDSGWTDCGGDNSITTGPGIKTQFLRILDVLLVINGAGGDKLCQVDLETKQVVKYSPIADPTAALTITPTGISNTGSYKIYYGYTYSSSTGETKISPILNQTISKPRDAWKTDGTEYLTINFTDTPPVGAKYRNLYIALAANGGVVQDSDMLMLAAGLDLNSSSIVDNGTLAIDVGRGNPPVTNSTDGPKVKYGIETNGRPVLFGDIEDEHNIWIGGDGEYALDFSSSNGGFRSQPSKGTNYYPASVIGFRNGQGVPSLTILFSNTQGLSKQATLEQKTVTYGNQSFVVWGVTEQNYGAAGVASSLGVINYKGQLAFPTTDGFVSMTTEPQLQNVLATKAIDKEIKPYTKRIKVEALNEVVGAAWDDLMMWLIPAYGFDTPNEILIRDLNNDGSWTPPLKIPAQWIGTVSPPDGPAFVYICQGNKILKLFESFGTVDYKGSGSEPFRTYAKGSLVGINEAHNAYQAVVQAMFYLVDVIGDITIGVNYRNQNGKIKTKKKVYKGPKYVLSSSGGWSDPQYTYAHFKTPARQGWSSIAKIDESAATLERVTKRVPLSINDLASELQWFIETSVGYNDYLLRTVSYEGENLGVKPDLR